LENKTNVGPRDIVIQLIKAHSLHTLFQFQCPLTSAAPGTDILKVKEIKTMNKSRLLRVAFDPRKLDDRRPQLVEGLDILLQGLNVDFVPLDNFSPFTCTDDGRWGGGLGALQDGQVDKLG
jgi:hypothetical protein